MTDWNSRAVSADDVVRHIPSGARVFIHGAAATPTPLLEAMVRRDDLHDVTLGHLHLEGPAPFVEPPHYQRFRSQSFFVGANVRAAVQDGRAEYIPVFLSDVPSLFSSRDWPVDVALIQVSPPDRHGNCTLGPSVDVARAAVDAARIVLAEVNAQMPRTHGNTVVHCSRLTAFVTTDRPLPTHLGRAATPEDAAIGGIVADLVPDGATLQTGIGAIPDAVLDRLTGKQDLGVHTEMFSDGIVRLVRSGAVTNERKGVHRGRIATSFVNGSQAVFDFVHDNPAVTFYAANHVNDPAVIRQNDAVIAVNSAIEVDLTGQVCADSIGGRIFSGIGGQLDFMRGAALSKGGKPIIALPATAKGGAQSRIVPQLKPGAGVVTTRGHVHWVVTEFGAVNLHGLSLRERAERLIAIAHPDHRATLRQAAAAAAVIPAR
ncbi:MAG: acetyl-CoA hydrolase/transferase C-terminal domain-containing protein [Gemmatimonadaceae bacterium]|nr:acetyl-CoA hydrolase/transferase C-terminal domain-containing protein [Gemmatimonadaceae bacterium]